jgi:DNA-binding MarR family transcriptional regulator
MDKEMTQYQTKVIKRFMSPDEFLRFHELYKASCKAKGGFGSRQINPLAFVWLDQYKSGRAMNEIAKDAGLTYSNVYEAVKRAALHEITKRSNDLSSNLE